LFNGRLRLIEDAGYLVVTRIEHLAQEKLAVAGGRRRGMIGVPDDNDVDRSSQFVREWSGQRSRERPRRAPP
jgi:hypothetical protein